MAFAVMLKQLRDERNISQKEVAEYLNMTRQAVAAYELGKREPDYDILRKLADFFDVSIDYLLGRATSRDVNAVTIGRNIELLRGNLTYKEMAEDIGRKVGAMVFPDLIEAYAKGERVPYAGTIMIFAKYAGVRESFFYCHNTPETLEKERELYKREQHQTQMNEKVDNIPTKIHFLDEDLWEWVMEEQNLKYIQLAREIQEAGLAVSALQPLIESIKNNK